MKLGIVGFSAAHLITDVQTILHFNLHAWVLFHETLGLSAYACAVKFHICHDAQLAG